MSISSSAKSYSLFSALLVIACLIAGYMAMSNYWPGYTLAQGKLTNAKNENQRLENAIASSETFLQTFQEQRSNATAVKLALPVNQSDMANFVKSIAELGSQSGVTITNLSVSEPPEGLLAEHSIQSINISMGATGTYLGFKDFMERLERHLRVVDVYRIALQTNETSGTSNLQYTIQLRTYYQQ